MGIFRVDSVPADVPLLQTIRAKEAEVKRLLAAERVAARERRADAARHAQEVVALAKADGRRQGEAQLQAARQDAERQAAEILARAQAESESLQVISPALLEAAAQRIFQLVIGDAHET